VGKEMSDLCNTESCHLDIAPNTFMDSLIDSLAYDTYVGEFISVGINDLPFWIQRFIAQHKKNKGHAPVSWTMGQPTTCEIEERIEFYFKNRFPNVEVIGLESNAEVAKDLNETLAKHGEYIHSKQLKSN
jgi:hypothetical protein